MPEEALDIYWTTRSAYWALSSVVDNKVLTTLNTAAGKHLLIASYSIVRVMLRVPDDNKIFILLQAPSMRPSHRWLTGRLWPHAKPSGIRSCRSRGTF